MCIFITMMKNTQHDPISDSLKYMDIYIINIDV